MEEYNIASSPVEAEALENFVLVEGGTFQMGSPEDEAWRSEDEIQHTVTVSNFYMSRYELTQAEYEAVTGNNPSNFSGADFPVENVSWLDAVAYCNARSEQEGLTAVYTIDGGNTSWDRSANGYRLPTEAEWEYACRAGTTTPFYMEISPSAEDANFHGHYPYMIEENYFSQGNLEVQPGEYRQTTVEVGSFEANTLPLTARNQVNRIITEMAVLDVAESGLVLREINPVYTVAEVIAATCIRLFYLHVHYE